MHTSTPSLSLASSQANTGQSSSLKLFLSTLISASAFFIGLTLLTFMVWPVVVSLFIDRLDYSPQLPLSEVQDKSFLELSNAKGKQLYPPLSGGQVTGPGNWIHIPSIDVSVPLVLSETIADEDVLKTLDDGAAMYPNGISPGTLGNVFVAAHSTGEPWKGKYRFAFLRINELAAGNVIHLDYNGARYTYTVTEKDIVVPSPDLRIESGRPKPSMTLMACWPLWSTQKRMLIHTELTNVTQLTAPVLAQL